MYKKIEAYLQERTRDNWGAPWHAFICHWVCLFVVAGYSYFDLSTDEMYLFSFIVIILGYWLMYWYEFIKQEKEKTFKGYDQSWIKRDRLEDLIWNHYGMFTGIASGIGVFY